MRLESYQPLDKFPALGCENTNKGENTKILSAQDICAELHTIQDIGGIDMNTNIRVRRGQIYMANLDPALGSEQSGSRPVLIIQNEVGNRFSPTTIVAAITSKVNSKKVLPVHVAIPENLGLEENSIVLLEQIRTLDKVRLGGLLGVVDNETMQMVDQALQISVKGA